MERSFLGVIRVKYDNDNDALCKETHRIHQYDLFVRLDEVCQFVQEHSESLSILELDL